MDNITSEQLPYQVKDIRGIKVGRLTVISFSEIRKGNAFWVCDCECGQSKIIASSSLKSGDTRSCGCIRKERLKKHGLSSHPAYNNYTHMMDRCYNPENERWERYGGRGITVCDRWHDPKNFIEDMGDGWKNNLSLERKNNDLGYSPENVIWATRKTQSNNTSRCNILELDGVCLNVTQWAEKLSIDRDILFCRLKRGWGTRKTLTTPVIIRQKSGSKT